MRLWTKIASAPFRYLGACFRPSSDPDTDDQLEALLRLDPDAFGADDISAVLNVRLGAAHNILKRGAAAGEFEHIGNGVYRLATKTTVDA